MYDHGNTWYVVSFPFGSTFRHEMRKYGIRYFDVFTISEGQKCTFYWFTRFHA